MPDSQRLDELRTALLDDLGRLGAGRVGDDRLGGDLYRALAGRPWRREQAGPPLTLTWGQAADLVDELRATHGEQPLDERQSGGEGDISPRAREALAEAGWAPSGESSPDGHRSVALVALDGGPGLAQARDGLLAVLPTGAELTEPDEGGSFEALVEAADQDAALQVVFDAIASAGADDHVALLEHVDLPEHWRHTARRPG